MPPPTAVASADPAIVVSSRPRHTRRATLVVGLIGCIALLVLVTLLSIAVDALRHYNETDTDQVIVHSLRVPRTVIGLLVGAALGLSGALMQGVTRNPLADPGILGVNGGAVM